MTAPLPPSSPDAPTRKTDLKVSRVAAAALAAVTTALVGSKLGVEGTVIGAAGASVVTTVATSVYQSSLERSREGVRSLAHRSRPAHPAEQTGPEDHPLSDGGKQSADRSGRSATWRWGAVAIAAIGGFALAMLVITGFEWASGEAVGGNGHGTTIGQVVNDRSGAPKPATPPAGPATETPTETSEPPTTSPTAPNGGSEVEPSPTTAATRPAPSGTTVPPLLPPLPIIGG